jgi:hypothetical protein
VLGSFLTLNLMTFLDRIYRIEGELRCSDSSSILASSCVQNIAVVGVNRWEKIGVTGVD